MRKALSYHPSDALFGLGLEVILARILGAVDTKSCVRG